MERHRWQSSISNIDDWWDDVSELHTRGLPITEVARRTGLSYSVIRKAYEAKGVTPHGQGAKTTREQTPRSQLVKVRSRYRLKHIPYETRRWVSPSRLVDLYPGSNYDGWMLRMKRDELGDWHRFKGGYVVYRDAVDDFVRRNGMPVNSLGECRRDAVPNPQPLRRRWVVGTQDTKPLGYTPDTEPPAEADYEEELDMPSPRVRPVIAYDDTQQPRKLVSWECVHDVVKVLVRHGAPSGEGPDLEHLQRVLSHWVLSQSEEADSRLWETTQPALYEQAS